MALYHVATLTPTKAELLSEWVPSQSWGPAAGSPVEIIGAYRFDDPEGRVGMETFLVNAGDTVLHVPLTYRDEPLAGAEDALITEMNHSAIGTRWVYDGFRDPRLVLMLAAVTMTGQGEALGMVFKDGRWVIAPTNVRIEGGGWSGERVPIDNLDLTADTDSSVVFRNERFELTAYRRPQPGPRPTLGLTAAWDGGSDPVVLAEVTEHTT